MKMKRWYTKQLYRIETLSPIKLFAFIVGFIIIPTILTYNFIISPLKFGRVFSEIRRERPLTEVGRRYKEAGVNPVLEDWGSDFNPRAIVYNRVPKCASIYTTRVLYKLGSKENNDFKVTSPYVSGEHPWLSDSEMQEHVNWLSYSNSQESLVYVRHQYFIDFEKWGGTKQPIYINIIRDPIDRFASFYYFVRNGNREGDGAEVKMPEMKRRLTLDECVQMRDHECMQPKWQLIPYFCGQEPMCRHRSSWALQKAKQNIERYFAVVGIVEDLDTTFDVMEKMMPGYFHGARDLNSQSKNLSPEDTKTIGKIPPSEATRKILKTRTSLALEYELYYFVRDRLYELNKQLNSGSYR